MPTNPVTQNTLTQWDLIRRAAGLNATKRAFVDAASMGAPPMDPSMAPPVGGAPMGQPIPMDPAMMGGAPPMDPAMMGGAPPMDPAAMDPSMAAMGSQEAMRSVIREEIQRALGGGEGGAAGGAGGAVGGVKKGGNKFDEAISQLKQEMQQQMKVFVTAMRKAGIEIPLADLFSLDGSLTPDAQLGQPSPLGQQQQGASEMLSPGASGISDNAASGVGKVAEFNESVEMLLKLASIRDSLKASAIGSKVTPFNPNQVDMDYFAGLYR